MELRDHQQKLLKSLKKDRFSLIKHSRQVGVTTVLKELIIETLLNDSEAHIVYFSNRLSSAKDFLRQIKLDNRIVNLEKIKDNVFNLKLKNGNRLKITSTLSSLKGCHYSHVIIDNACFIKKLEIILEGIIPLLSSIEKSKLILASSNKKGSPYFNKLFGDDKNNFIKNKILWNEDIENLEIYENLRSIISEEDFKNEMDLEDITETKTNKDQLLSFRVNKELYYSLTKKLVEKDLSLSDYLRSLIEGDIS